MLQSVIRFALKNKFAVWLLTIIVAVAGLYAGMNMKQETIPNIEVPVLTVNTVLPGAAPQEVQDKVTIPLEQLLKNKNGVNTVTSTSMENVSSIVLEYKYEKDMKQAEDELREALRAFKAPSGAKEPEISKLSINNFPVISLSVSGKDQSLEQITKLVESDIKPALESIPGIGTVTISGQHMKEVQLTFKQDKMKQLGLSEDTVKGIIQGSAIQAPLGLFELGKEEKTIVVDGKVTTLDDLKNLAIPAVPSAGAQNGAMATGAGQAANGPARAGAMGAVPNGGAMAPGAGAAMPNPAQNRGANAANGTAANPALKGAAATPAAAGIPTVKLSEIADIQLVGKKESISRTNGQESVGINVSKAADANTVDVVNAVKKQADQIKSDHPGTEIRVLMDQGQPIEESVHTMFSKAIFGALFAVIVILLFLRNIRTTLISVVSIPLSLLIALLVLKQMDITINIMTLGAMTVAIGRVVDDSIVVIENNYRRMQLSTEPLKGSALVIDATREMFMPILASTLVTIAVFLPLGTVSGPIGELFMPFALTMVFALLASLLVAVTVVPAMAHFMFRKGLTRKRTHEDKPGALSRGYKKVLNWSLNHKVITSLLALVLFGGSLGLASIVGVSFLPEEEQKYAMITYNPGPGTVLSDVEQTALKAEEQILKREGVTNLQYSIGGQNPMSVGPSKSGLFFIQYKNDMQNFNAEKERLVQDLAKLDPAGEWKQMDFGGGVGGSKLSLFVYGDSIKDIKPAVEQIQNLVKNNSSFEKVDTSLSRTYDQYTLVADQDKLSKLGLTAGQIAMNLSPVRERPELTEISVDGKKYKVYIQADQQKYSGIADIENKTITTPLGTTVQLKDIVKVEQGTSPNTVTRKNGKEYAQVSANITAKDVRKASADLQQEIDKLNLPAGVKVEFGGVTKQINDTFKQLGLAMAAAVAIVYLLMVITFGGALTPFAILFSLPLTVIGAVAGLYVAGETISASALMGMLMLIGIVVTNAIVLLDRVHHNEERGLSTREALLEAGSTRLRPILMTALATVGALLPLALGFEKTGGSLISKGLGVTVIGGLTSSTLLTLLIVPIVYEILAKFRRKRTASDSNA